MVPDLVPTLHATRPNTQFVSLTDGYTRALNISGPSALELSRDRYLRYAGGMPKPMSKPRPARKVPLPRMSDFAPHLDPKWFDPWRSESQAIITRTSNLLGKVDPDKLVDGGAYDLPAFKELLSRTMALLEKCSEFLNDLAEHPFNLTVNETLQRSLALEAQYLSLLAQEASSGNVEGTSLDFPNKVWDRVSEFQGQAGEQSHRCLVIEVWYTQQVEEPIW